MQTSTFYLASMTGLTAVLMAAAPASAAAQIDVVSYNMLNGGTGSYNYHDDTYNGSGDKTTDYAALADGVGDLTDGVISDQVWSTVEAPAGAGPYVGWWDRYVANPVITFFFGGDQTIDSIRLYVDNSGSGGVSAPVSVLVDDGFYGGGLFAYGNAAYIDIPLPGLTGSSHTLKINHATSWVFVSEVQFFGAAGAVPEPASWAMMIGGFGLAGAALRRRPRSAMRFA